MKRRQVLLTEAQHREVQRIAKSESISAAEVIRRLIDLGLADTRRRAKATAAEHMASFYTENEDPTYREIDPWAAQAGDAGPCA